MMTEAVETTRRDADWHAERIAESWRSTVEGIIETGRRIAEAKAAMPHGEFGQMVKERLPFSSRTAQALMQVSEDKRISNAQHVAHLPANWGTLAELTRLDDATFERAVSDGTIHPECKRSDIKRLTQQPKELGEQPTHEECVDSFERLVQSGRTFGTIYADPPWAYENQRTRAATGNYYESMSVDDLCEMPVVSLAAEKAHLHLWTTNAFLRDAFRVIDAWGFDYRSVLVWKKPHIGIGNYWRVQHEFLLLGIRGGCQFPDGAPNTRSVIEHDRLKHSQKPAVFRELIEQVSPGPRVELFAREYPPDWTVWGNQIERGLYSPEITEAVA